jgi:hypothetical protein
VFFSSSVQTIFGFAGKPPCALANLVLSDDVSLALNVNHSARIRCLASVCPRCGKPWDSLKTIRS